MSQLIRCPKCGGMAHYIADNVRCLACEANSPPQFAKSIFPSTVSVSRPAVSTNRPESSFLRVRSYALLATLLLTVMAAGLAAITLIVIAQKAELTLTAKIDSARRPTPRRKQAASKPSSTDVEGRKMTSGARHTEVFPGATDNTLKSLIARLERRIEIESVMYWADSTMFDGRPVAVVRFPGHQAATQKAEEQFDSAAENTSTKLDSLTLENSSEMVDTELSDAFFRTITVEKLEKTVTIVKYESPQRASGASPGGDILRKNDVIWSWDCFYFVGDPVEIARIRHALTRK